MADLNPLKFLVAIQDDATGQLNEIQKKLETLKEHTIKLKVEGKEEIHTAFNIDKLVEQIQNAKRALSGDSFEKFSTYMTNAAESVDKLTESFVKFKSTIGSNQDIKEMLSGWGAAIREINAAMAAANATKSSAGGKKGASGQTTDELKQQEKGLVKVADAIGRVRSAMAFGGAMGGIPFLEAINTVGERNIQTLIKEQGHIERLIAIAKKSIDFGEGHPVFGMGRLRGDQMRNLQDLEALKKVITEILFAANQGDQAMIRFLNTSSALRTTPFGKDAMGNDVTLLGGHFDKLTHYVTGTASAMRNLNKEMRLDVNAKTIGQQWADSMTKAGRAASDLETKLEKLRISGIRESATKAGLNTDAYDKAIERIQRYQRVLEYIQQRGGHDASRILGSVGYRTSLNDLNVQSAALTKNIAEKERAANATRQLTADEQRLAQALGQSTDHMNRQSTLLSDLKSLATQYLGVWGGQQFLNNIIQIGGQLEMQRLSIGAILQNQAQANTLFNQIKGLATQSPFGVVELDQMTKQLTAYGFKYHELFDMTKRLADISAATGTSVDRLALALGHVRSEGALSGYTLRQFSMGNVPLLEKLSEKLGKTKKEIREMTRSKDIDYATVESVLKDLTNEGGMFYNMQEVISESVKAKFKNVKDAMDIMYGEMAEGAPGDALKEVANVLMELTRNWKDVATVMGTAAAVWGIHRAAIMLTNAALGSNTAAVSANILSYKKKHAVELEQKALTQTLTAEEKELIATRNTITAANIRTALSTGAMTKSDALRLVSLRKLSLEEAKALIRTGQLTAAEVRAALAGEVFGIKMGKAGAMLQMFGIQAKAAMAALLTNPWTWAIAGITAIVELWQRNNRELERAKELNDAIYERSQEGLKNTRTMMKNTGIRVDWRNNDKEEWNDVTGTFGQQSGGIIRFVKPDFDKNDDVEGTIEAWQQYIRDYAATPNRILNAAMTVKEKVKDEDGLETTKVKAREAREQYDLLYESVIKVSQAQAQMARISDAIEFAINETNGGLDNEDLLTNIGDYDKQVKKVSQNIGKTYNDLRKYIDETIKKAQKEDKEFGKATKGMDNYAQAFAHLVRNHEKFSKADELFKNAHFGVSGAYEGLLDGGLFDGGTMDGLNSARETMEKDLDQFFKSLDSQLRMKKDWHIDEVLAGKLTLTEDKQQALLGSWKETLSKVQGLTDETARDLTEKFEKRYNITIDAETEEALVKAAQVEQTLDNLVNGDWDIPLNFVENMNDAIDEARKKYKLAKEYFEKTEKIRLKFGIDLKMGQLMDEKTKQSILSKIENEDIRKEVEKVINGLNQASTAFNKATEASHNLGFSLEDEKKGKKKTGTKKTGTGTKAYKDEFAKRWDERIRIMKEAYDWYDKWEKKVGNEAAIEETNAKYADIFREWKTDKLLPMDFDVREIADYTKYVEKIRDDALARYQAQKNDKGKNNGQEALRVYRQAVALLNDVKFDNFSKAAEDFKSIIEQVISDLNNRWDIFNTVRNATGNAALASRIAGFGIEEMNARTSADAMRYELLRQLRSAGGEDFASSIPLDTHLDEEGIRKMLEEAIPDSDNAEEYKNKIDGLIRSYQEWQKLQQQVFKDDISVFANLTGSVVSYDAKVNKLNDDLRKQKDSIAASLAAGQIGQDDADKAIAIAEANFDWESMKLSADYANIYNHAIAMSREEFDEAANAIENLLKRLRELELISDEDYISELGKLNKARKEWSETGFLGERGAVGSFISGGNEGLLNYYAERRDKANRKAAQYKEGSEENEKWKAEADHYGKLFNNLSKLSDAAKDVVTAFQTLQSGLDLVTNLFDSLGMEGAANVAGDAGGILGGALQGASSLSALGPWGMAAGAAVGLVSGIAQTHDKSLERQIGKLREDVQRIEANTKLIQQARERTLGLDNGILRRLYAQQYESSTSKAQRDMYDYYSRNSSGNGYQQEFNNLIQQRQDYLSILDKQESKKKKSQSDIEETKSKIAELDDQIRFFSQDLAKELWDIDIKGWADQLSDALASAFENGESMANAYKDTVTSILQSLAQRMLKTAYLEKMFESLQDRLFGPNGVVDPTDMQGSMSKATSVIADFFGKGGEGEQTIAAATEFMTAFQRGLESSGLSLLNDSGKTLSSSVQGTSEETSNLLAAYVNALRQDVSINRLLLTEFVAQQWPSYLEEFTNHVRTVARIDNNVQVMMEMMRDGRGAMYDEIHSLRSRIDNVVNGIESFAMK